MRIAGYNSLSRINELLNQYDAKRVMLVSGRRSYELCGAKAAIEPALRDRDIIHFQDFELNPKIEDGIRGAKLARDNKVDLVLAVGGGSPMDIAKLVLAYLPNIENAEAITKGEIAVEDAEIPLICIPTTAGSGSEATHFAVVYIGKQKYSVASQYLLPSSTILDGQLLLSAPSYQRAVNGLDALAQAMEGCWGRKATPEIRKTAYTAIKLLNKSLTTAVQSNDPAALQNVMEAANLAGQVINVAKTTAAHAFSYAFTSFYDVPHGHAVWLTLPAIFELHLSAAQNSSAESNFDQTFRDVMAELSEILQIQTKTTASLQLKTFMLNLGVEPEMSKIGVNSKNARRDMSTKVNVERLGNNPIALSQSDIAKIFDY